MPEAFQQCHAMTKRALTHLFLSPHLDDVVYSCGGMIHQQIQTGDSVVVVTMCAGDPPCNSVSPFARAIHDLWRSARRASPADMVAARRREDLKALESLGAQAVHLDIPDCIYRVHPADGWPLDTTATALMGNIHPSEPALIRRVAVKLASLRRSVGRHHFYVPLAIGSHVDHQVGRRAAEVTGGIHAYYEDFPYVADAPDGWAERPACWPHSRSAATRDDLPDARQSKGSLGSDGLLRLTGHQFLAESPRHAERGKAVH